MNLRPLYNRVVVRREEEKTLSDGGIVIPEKAATKPQRGTVIAAGPGRYLKNGDLVETQVQVGDIVLFGSRAGEELEIDGEKLIVMTDMDILATDNDE